MTDHENIMPAQVSIADLQHDAANPRRHGKKNMAAIRDSLLRFGQVEPLIVQKSSMRVVGGNGRLDVMRSLKWTDANVILLDLTDTQAITLGIILNRTGELSAWDKDTLADLLGDLNGEDGLSWLGFDDKDVRRLLGDDDGPENKGAASVMVTCENEQDQVEMLKQCQERDLECRALCS